MSFVFSSFWWYENIWRFIAILRDLLIALRRRYFAILSRQNDAFWLAKKLSCKHDSTALNGFGAHRSRFASVNDMWGWMVLTFISFRLSLQSFWHCSRTTYNIFLWCTCTMIQRIQLFSWECAKISRWREIYLKDFLECESGHGK